MARPSQVHGDPLPSSAIQAQIQQLDVDLRAAFMDEQTHGAQVLQERLHWLSLIAYPRFYWCFTAEYFTAQSNTGGDAVVLGQRWNMIDHEGLLI